MQRNVYRRGKEVLIVSRKHIDYLGSEENDALGRDKQ